MSKRSVVRPQARWSDTLRQAAGRSWTPETEDQAKWHAILEAYVQQYDMLMMMIQLFIPLYIEIICLIKL